MDNRLAMFNVTMGGKIHVTLKKRLKLKGPVSGCNLDAGKYLVLITDDGVLYINGYHPENLSRKNILMYEVGTLTGSRHVDVYVHGEFLAAIVNAADEIELV